MLNPERVFRDLGGQFVASPQQLVEKISKIKVFLFDWDGVFNAGYKGEGATSLYSETDSMGTNLMRFGKYLQNGKIPFTAIITGEQNESAFKLARREHFNAVFFKIKNKRLALSYLEKVQGIKPEEVCFFFDDVLDMAIAKEVGLRVMINRNSSPLFTGFVRENQFADYITAYSGSQNGLREASEVIMSFSEIFDRALDERINYTDNYQQYIHLRNEQTTRFFTQEDNQIIHHM